MISFWRVLVAVLWLGWGAAAWAAEGWQLLPAGPAPDDNPLKGLVPYADAKNPAGFPHSMEFSYFPLAAVMQGPQQFDWAPFDRFLDQVAARGRQAVARFYLEYPGRPSGMPAYLHEAGVAVQRWSRNPAQPGRVEEQVLTPDYAAPALRTALANFIAALGARYDGDPRLAYLTAGLLGLWGEWHDWPRNELFADKALQQQVMDAYARAFRRTPVLLRYPAGETDPVFAANADSAFGFHDDSFAWNTLATKSSYFVAKLRAAGAVEAWRTRPVGGEIRPEAWGKVFDAEPGLAMLQDFDQCAAATHVSWLMDSGMFRAPVPEARRQRALEAVRGMGYVLTVRAWRVAAGGRAPEFEFELENRGIAPFYADWPLRARLLDAAGQEVASAEAPAALRGIQPEARALRRVRFAAVPAGHYQLEVQGANPLPGGRPVRFANAAQDAGSTGWLSVGRFAAP